MCDVCGNLPEWMRGKAAAAAPAKRKKRRELAPPRAIEIPAQVVPAQGRPTPPLAAPRPIASVPVADGELVAFFKDWRRRMAERAAMPAPVALPCVPPPPVHKVVKKRKPVATPPAATTPGTTPPKPTGSH